MDGESRAQTIIAVRYRCQYQPLDSFECGSRVLARVGETSVRSATCHGKICTPPETLTSGLRPAITKLACEGTARGAGYSSSGCSLMRFGICKPERSMSRSFTK